MPVLLGVDPGERRIGLAICDDGGRIAVPLAIIDRQRHSLDWVAVNVVEQARRGGAAGIVCGLPLNVDGTAGPQAKRAQQLARRIVAQSGLPLTLWDERYSSFVVEQRVQTARFSSGRKRRPHCDDLAAAVILQSYLDAQRQAAPQQT